LNLCVSVLLPSFAFPSKPMIESQSQVNQCPKARGLCVCPKHTRKARPAQASEARRASWRKLAGYRPPGVAVGPACCHRFRVTPRARQGARLSGVTPKASGSLAVRRAVATAPPTAAELGTNCRESVRQMRTLLFFGRPCRRGAGVGGKIMFALCGWSPAFSERRGFFAKRGSGLFRATIDFTVEIRLFKLRPQIGGVSIDDLTFFPRDLIWHT